MVLTRSKILSILLVSIFLIHAEESKKTNFSSLPLANEAIAGACLGAVQAVSSPLKDVAQALISPFLHPVDTFNYLRLTLFTLNNSKALTFTKLVHGQQSIGNVVNNLIIDPANSSNKLLRKQLLNDSEKTAVVDENEFIFGINNCIDHLNNLKNTLAGALPIYESEMNRRDHSGKFALSGSVASGAISNYSSDGDLKKIGASVLAGATIGFLAGKVIQSPYSNEDLEQIIFLSKQVIKHCEFMVTLLSGLKGLSDITDKKDTVNMLLKNLTAELAHLAFIVEPSMAFDPRYKGLKILYDAAKLTEKGVTKGTGA